MQPCHGAPEGRPEETESAFSRSLLDALVQAEAPGGPSRAIQGLVIGWITALESPEAIRVLAPTVRSEPLMARTLCPIGPDRVGAQCALLFEQGDPDRPVIMGLLQHAALPITTQGVSEATQDSEKIHIRAGREIALHCGKASLRMTQDGRIELKGTTLISHASSLNRIRGGTIKLN